MNNNHYQVMFNEDIDMMCSKNIQKTIYERVEDDTILSLLIELKELIEKE